MGRVYTGISRRWHDDYDRGRPGWPASVLDVPGLETSAEVVELGSGLCARTPQERAEGNGLTTTGCAVVHDRLEGAPKTAAGVSGSGWSRVLSGLETLLETGQPLSA